MPCEAADPGFGVHQGWTHVRPSGHFIAPRRGVLRADGGFDLVVHFHGHRPARKEFVRSGEDLVLLGVSLGIGRAYGPPFADGKRLAQMISGVERELARREGRPAQLQRLALSSWSRGYEAIAEVLRQPLGAKVDALILLDSLHGSRDARRGREQLEPFRRFAIRAANGQRMFVVTHSAISPPDYASAWECTHYLVDALGGVPRPATRSDPLGLQLVDFYTKGQFHARGYAGNGKLDHCAHFGIYASALRLLARRWRGGDGD